MTGILARLFSRQAPEQRAAPFYAPIVAPVLGAGSVNTVLAENLSTVTASVNAITSVMGSLPAYVYRKDGASRVEAPSHPVARLIRQPNPRQTWPDFMEFLLGSTLLQGNGLAAIETDAAGRANALLPVPWNAVQVVVLPSGRLAFDVVAYRTPWGGNGQPRRYLDTEVLHLKDRSDDGWLGRSRISRAPGVLNNALSLQDWCNSMWQNQATPSGAVELEGSLNEEQFKRLRAQFDSSFTGTGNARKVLILDNKASWKALSVSPEDAEVLASRRFSGEEIARLFGVPPPIVGDLSHGTFTNSETAGRWFAQFTLAPWARKIEAEFQRSVFADPAFSLEIDLSGLMRGDFAARWQANVAAVQAGILDVDEVREAEGYNPRGKTQAPAGEGAV